MVFVICLILASLIIISASLQRTYNAVPLKELRRRARSGDSVAQMLHKAATYGTSLRTILWIIVLLTGSTFFIYTARNTETWFALLSIIVVLWFGFIWLPAQQATRVSVIIATRLSPVFAKILHYIHPVIDFFARRIAKHRPVRIHTGLYDKDDLIELLDKQYVQLDNRISEDELQIARHALTFGELSVGDVLTPRRVVKMVSIEDTIGPILMTELHDSGFSRFPVYGDAPDKIVGFVLLRDLIGAKEGGAVEQYVNKKVAYVHEDQSLHLALAAIIKTHQHMFIVVNSFEEFVGVVTLEDVLEQIIGQQIVDEFDQYDDMRAVATRHAREERDQHLHPVDGHAKDNTNT